MFSRYDSNNSGQLEFNEFLVLFKDRLTDVQNTLKYISLKPAKSSSAEASVLEVRHVMLSRYQLFGDIDPTLLRNDVCVSNTSRIELQVTCFWCLCCLDLSTDEHFCGQSLSRIGRYAGYAWGGHADLQ